jgi:hypothetical protein
MLLWLRSLNLAIVLLALCAPEARAQDKRELAIEAATGTALSLPLPLTIEQNGFAPLSTTAHYATRPFEGAPYYAWRIGLWHHASAWELQLVHSKVYLENPPPEVERFQVTHGYDMLTVGKAWQRGSLVVRAGGGIVFAHPESTIRGQTWPETGGLSLGFIGLLNGGYFFTGPTGRVSISRRFGHRFFVAPELELTASRARVPIVDGEASVPNIALHPRVAIGVRF